MTTRTVKYSYHAEPTVTQQQWLTAAYGAVRVVYNNYLYQKEQIYKGLQSNPLTPLDRYKLLSPDYAWMRDYPQKCAQQAVRQAEVAYKNYFTGLSGKRKNKPGKPRFKKKRAGGSLSWNGASLQVKLLSTRWAAVRLPKEGSWLKFRLNRELPSKPTGVTLKLSPAGEYTVSFTVKQAVNPPKTQGPAAGVDPGLTDLVSVVSDDGSRYKVAAPRSYRQSERKLARLQRDHSRKKTGSQNREKARLALAKQYAKFARQRLDFTRKIASRLACENQAVAFEDLTVKSLIRTKLSKSFADAGLGNLKIAVASACEREGTTFTLVNPAYTSQACAVCAVIDGPKALSVREWSCDCGALLDRDYNAALNMLLLAGGHSESLNGLEGQVRRRKLASPVNSAVSVEEATSYKAYKPRRRRTRAKSMARRALLEAQA